MAHERNVEGLRLSAAQRHEAACRRTEEALQRMLREGQPVNFKTVAKAAAVSTAWLYGQPSIKARIQRLRDQSIPKVAALKAPASDASKDAMIATLRQRIKQVEAENRELRKQLEIVYGQLHMQS